MKKLVVYYSLEGTTKLVAENMAKAIGADILRLRPKKDIKTKGFLKYLIGGTQVFAKKRPELHILDKNPEKYDMIYIGSPVWAGNFTPAVRTFLTGFDYEGKKIALFCTCKGGEGGTLANMKKFLARNEVVGEKIFSHVTKDESGAKAQAKEWAKGI